MATPSSSSSSREVPLGDPSEVEPEAGPSTGPAERIFITDDEEDDKTDGGVVSACVKSKGKENEENGKDHGEEDQEAEQFRLNLTKAFDDVSITTESEQEQDPEEKSATGKAEVEEIGDLDLNLGSGEDDGSAWRAQKRHVFVLSEAGKPIFSRHGNEEKLVTLFGVMQALVSFIQDGDDSIRSVRAGDTIIVFCIRKPLITVCVSNVGDSVNQIQVQLMYVYNLIVSVISSKQLFSIFEKRHNYDLRRLLAGSERLIYNLCNLMESDPSFVLGAVRCLPLASSVRDTISQTISQTMSKMKDKVVFGILLANNQLISLVRMKKCFMHPMDLHILINLIDATESFKTAETWSPICLPKFDDSGYVHGHISYLSDECQACLVLLTVDRESFFPLSQAKQRIVERLKRHNCLEAINASMNNSWPTMSYVNVPEIRHFLYKARSIAQFMSPVLESPYVETNPGPGPRGSSNSSSLESSIAQDLSCSTFSSFSEASTQLPPSYAPPEMSSELQRLYSTYFRMHSKLHTTVRPTKILYWVDDTENWLGWATSQFELYVAFEPMVKKSAALAAVNKILKWIKKEEDRIFIMNSPTF